MSLMEMKDLKGHLYVTLGCNSDGEAVMLSWGNPKASSGSVSVIVWESTCQAGCLLNSNEKSKPLDLYPTLIGPSGDLFPSIQ